MEVSKNLVELAKIFSKKAPLYLVGGIVRNSIIGINAQSDIDITSPLTPGEVEEILHNTPYIIVGSYKRLGTLVINHAKSNETYEYTTFRKDSYKMNSGSHMPIDVVFIRDIEGDAERRDFKMNAIYYDILKGTFVDPLGGIRDLGFGIISTTKRAESVFSEDALRILRLIRQASELNFDIEEKTKEAAIKKVDLLVNIHEERKKDEFMKIMFSDKKYKERSYEFGHYVGLKRLCDMGIMQYIIPQLMDEKDCYVNKEKNKRDLLEHTLLRVKYAPEQARLAALMQDIGKPVCLKRSGKIIGCDKVGEAIVYKALGEKGLKFPNKTVHQVARLVRIQEFNINGNAKVNTIKKFILKNIEILDVFYQLREAEWKARDEEMPYHVCQKIKEIHQDMIKENVPFTLANLLVNGHDCMAAGIFDKEISMVLKDLLWEAIINPAIRSKDKQMEYLKKWKERRSKKNE